MAIIQQHPVVDEKGALNYKLVKHYSDSGKSIVQLETGKVFDEAVDVHPCKFTYEEIEEIEFTAEEELGNEDDNLAGNYS